MTDRSSIFDATLTRRHVIAGLATVSAVAATEFPTAPAEAQTAAGTILITGSNRGIGLELARAYANRDWKVYATCRRPDEASELQAIAAERPKLVIEQLDVLDHDMIDALANKLSGEPIDVVLNNAAILGAYEDQIYPDVDFALLGPIVATNVNGPLKVTQAFLEHVAASAQRKVVALTSTQGSIGKLRDPSLIYYKTSKAALNMAMSVAAKRLKSRDVIVSLISPGAVDTDMMRQLPVKIPLISPEESAAMVSAVIDGLTMEKSGKFLSHRGEEEPW